jgi:hypothetical protein
MAAKNMADLRNFSLTCSRLQIISLEATNSGNNWEGGAGSKSVSYGAAYYEETVNIAATGVCQLGWSKGHPERNILLDYDYKSIEFGSTRKKSHDKTF